MHDIRPFFVESSKGGFLNFVYKKNCLIFYTLSHASIIVSITTSVWFQRIVHVTRLTYNCAHLRSTKETLTIEYLKIILKNIWVKIFRVKIFLGKNFWGENFFGWKFLGLKLFGWKFVLDEIFLGENCFWWNVFE